MAHVKRFKHDVFLSYAHADDRPFPGESEGGVTQLVEGIKTGLGHKGLGDSSVWMDPALAGNLDLTQQLLDTLAESATLVVVLSEAYLVSEWCARERSAFLGLVKRRRSVGSVFVVELDRLEGTRPGEFEGLLGYRFWKEERGGRSDRLTWSAKGGCHAVLGDLCHDLARQLRHMNTADTSGTSPAQPTTQGEEGTVYLAEVTDDIDGKRDEVRRFLQQHGVEMLPTGTHPLEPGEYETAVTADLARADLFVQLLSAVPGKRNLVHRLHRLAIASEKPILQWHPSELDLSAVESEEHRSILKGTSVRAEGLESFKANVLDFLRRPKAPPPPKAKRGGATVFVNMDSEDRALARQVCDILKAQGVGWWIPATQGPPGEIRKDLEENLEHCDAVIVVYGVATATWVRAQLRQHDRIFSQRAKVLRAFAVFHGAAEEHVDLGVDMPNLAFVQVGPHDLETKVAEFVRLVEGYDA